MENIILNENEPEGNLDKKYEAYFKQGMIEFITFHPSYSYEEFVEGITVETKGENATCENSDGAFQCDCNEGYNGTGELCQGKII